MSKCERYYVLATISTPTCEMCDQISVKTRKVLSDARRSGGASHIAEVGETWAGDTGPSGGVSNGTKKGMNQWTGVEVVCVSLQFQPREFSAATGAEMKAVRPELFMPLLPLPWLSRMLPGDWLWPI